MADNSRMTPEDFNLNSRLRASDADRDRAASVLNEAMAQGRLTAEEHSERLDALYAAKTHADIVPVIDDLPHAAAMAVPTGSAAPAPAGTGRRMVAVFGGVSRKGRWQPEPVTRIVAVFGGADLDLREASLPGREITISAVAVFGGVSITVPPEMRVIDSGVAIMGGREVSGDSDESMQPDAPVLRITGICAFGGVEVKRKPRGNGKEPSWPLRIR
jgi:uncharacterized protein DUF1707/cell wall-active antibiotic response 4TMS protein YvqF